MTKICLLLYKSVMVVVQRSHYEVEAYTSLMQPGVLLESVDMWLVPLLRKHSWSWQLVKDLHARFWEQGFAYSFFVKAWFAILEFCEALVRLNLPRICMYLSLGFAWEKWHFPEVKQGGRFSALPPTELFLMTSDDCVGRAPFLSCTPCAVCAGIALQMT